MSVFLRSILAATLPVTWAQAQSLEAPRYEAGRTVSATTCGECAGPGCPSPVRARPTRLRDHPRLGRPPDDRGRQAVAGGLSAHHPAVAFETRLMGTGTAMAGLHSRVADVALMGRESTNRERMAFEYVFRYQPTRVEVATGSLDVPGNAPALVVFVHKENPLSRLTLAQLDALFSHERRRGHGRVETWDQLGLGGDWAGRPINLYGYDLGTGTGVFFRRVVMKDSYKLNWDRLREFAEPRSPEGPRADAGRLILGALAADRFGIAVSNLPGANPGVKPLALAADEGGPWFEATRETVLTRHYPLTRVISAWVNRPSGQPLDQNVGEFLRYILSHEGQSDVLRDGGFLPLCAEIVREQLGTDADRHFYGVPVPAYRKERLPR